MQVQKLHFLLVSLYRGTIWSTSNKVGAEIALFPNHPVQMDHLEHQFQCRCRNCTFCQSACIGGPFAAPVTIVTMQVQKMHFLLVSMYRGPFGAPVTMQVQKLHFSPITLYRGTIWSTSNKVGAEIALFTSQHVQGDHLEHQLQCRCKNSTFPQSAYIGGQFGAPLTMQVQKLHFVLVSLYRGTIWSTTDNVVAEIALFPNHPVQRDHLEHH